MYDSGRASYDGRFRLDNVAVGVHQIKVSAPGYETKIKTVTIDTSHFVDIGEVVLPRARVKSGAIGAMFVSNAGRVSINLILPESPAFNAGLRVSDVVLSIDDQPVTSAMQAERRSNGEPGTIVAVTVARDGAQRSFAIVRAN